MNGPVDRMRKGRAQHRAAALALILVALLFRAAIPTGYMLAPDGAGHVALAFCSGDGNAPHRAHAGHERQAPAEQPCPYALALHAATPPPAPATVAALPPVAPLHASAPARPATLAAFIAVHPPATGPPAIL